jgi:erythrocyte band 7 integral membrane protein
MQIRQLDALQNMARTAGSKVVFGTSPSEIAKKKIRLLIHFLVPMNLSSMGSAGMSDAGRQEVQNQITASIHPDAAQARAYAQANPGMVGSSSGGPGPTMDLSSQVQNAGLYQSIERM